MFMRGLKDYSIRNNLCFPPPYGCGKPLTDKYSDGPNGTGFRDALSYEEYQISALCQECQDAFFTSEVLDSKAEPDPDFEEQLDLEWAGKTPPILIRGILDEMRGAP